MALRDGEGFAQMKVSRAFRKHVNPLGPPISGDFEAGGHPQTPGKGASLPCTPHFLNGLDEFAGVGIALRPPEVFSSSYWPPDEF